MPQLEFIFTQQVQSNTVCFIEARQRFEISTLRDELQRKKDSARYLYGGKRGAWGRRTGADDKRDKEIGILKTKIEVLENKYQLKN